MSSTTEAPTACICVYLICATKQSLGDYSLNVPASGLRNAGHRMADFIYEKLTGTRGAFSTRLSYVNQVAGKYQLLISDSDGQNAVVALNSL